MYLMMAFSLWNLFEASILCLNAICILSEERFLNRFGWGSSSSNHGFGETRSTRSQIFNLVHSIRTVAKVPLVLLNIMTIFLKLIIG